MGKIENVKTYAGKDLENIFFRPMLTGPGAEELGIRVMYNMPVPTTLHFWRRSGDILQKFTSAGWSGGNPADKFQKTIELQRVKAEIGYSAEDYFSLVYEQISGRSDINMEDLGGTELEEAETALFKEAIAESIRVTMWLGDTGRTGADSYNTFDGIIPKLYSHISGGGETIKTVFYNEADPGNQIFDDIWKNLPHKIKDMKSQADLAFFVTSDVYNAYEDYVNSCAFESAYIARQEGRDSLKYRGIPVVDLRLNSYLPALTDIPQSFAVLTDRRNLALAVNTSDFPGTEVRMWYNPDEMENRQRAVFMAGADYLLPELVVLCLGE